MTGRGPHGTRFRSHDMVSVRGLCQVGDTSAWVFSLIRAEWQVVLQSWIHWKRAHYAVRVFMYIGTVYVHPLNHPIVPVALKPSHTSSIHTLGNRTASSRFHTLRPYMVWTDILRRCPEYALCRRCLLAAAWEPRWNDSAA